MAPADDVDGAAKSSPLSYAKYGTRVDRESARAARRADRAAGARTGQRAVVLPWKSRRGEERERRSADRLPHLPSGKAVQREVIRGMFGLLKKRFRQDEPRPERTSVAADTPTVCPEGRARPRRATGRQGQEDLLGHRRGLALFNLFGQRPATTTAEADAATLEVYCRNVSAAGSSSRLALPRSRRARWRKPRSFSIPVGPRGSRSTRSSRRRSSCKPRREACLRARADPGRPQARLPPAPGQPDERRASLRRACSSTTATSCWPPSTAPSPCTSMDIVIRALVIPSPGS